MREHKVTLPSFEPVGCEFGEMREFAPCALGGDTGSTATRCYPLYPADGHCLDETDDYARIPKGFWRMVGYFEPTPEGVLNLEEVIKSEEEAQKEYKAIRETEEELMYWGRM